MSPHAFNRHPLARTGRLAAPPWLRGLVEGVATLLGGLGHALPFLLPDVRAALLVASSIISWVRFHYFHMQLGRSMLQVVARGALVS
jgi:erythrin-vacuolar iron transport family protein